MRAAVDRYLPWVLTVLVLALMFGILREINSRPQPGGPSIAATPAPELKGAPVVRVPSAPVRTYSSTKAKLKLPAAAQVNPAEQVVAAAVIKSDPRLQTVTTTLNTDTGEAQSYVKIDPYPWFAVEARGEAKLAAGYKLKGGTIMPIVRLGVSYEAVRVKAATVGVTATADTDGDAFIGVSASYRW